ncbi:MAG: 30S ribosomal protein S13 [Candidatus Woykebacteria bacterium GWB1_45_5]|uniref:Small ribosomal subunit protein uS13 n=2 Tax=Candidatus Woykeibacteriota TaxID=1817899 RepID=A0A1G1W2N0_9BACT|nr:MAG: 30S ribosomal protein S13 [Candidatus Woykebacteria bacterium GWA1_44_8]OGY23311.1 MAG: 30S ribosomal protein S13 [Candidatus Woykebacteria bacterium GWB1_45_5]
MARIAGVELPENRKILYALPVIYGIGVPLAQKIIESTKIAREKRVKDLSEEEISKIQKEVEKHAVEGDLRRSVAQNIRRLEEIGSYRGIRHRRGLPARGQRTRSNARTKRGKRQTVGAMRKELRAKVYQKEVGEEKKG